MEKVVHVAPYSQLGEFTTIESTVQWYLRGV